MTWHTLTPHVLIWHDSCNVYALIGPQGAIIINAGTGRWLDALDQLPQPPIALLCTHYFRDHSAGAARAARMGIPIYVPEGEQAIFADPAEHFRQRDTYIIYDNYWDLFAPIEPTPVAILRDYEQITLAGLELQIIPLPGVTITQIGVAVRLPDGLQVFCGEAIHSPGRVARVAPFQYNYNDLGGAVSAYASAADLRVLQPAALFPSLGIPMLGGVDVCDQALAQLQENLVHLCAGRPEEAATLRTFANEPLEQVSDHVWMTTQTEARNWFVISASGKALVIDYGYDSGRGLLAASYSKPYRRRALLHSIAALKRHTGIERIDVALISHFHDDHVCGVPLLQRLFGTECWAAEPFADLLAEPDSHCFPCDWPQPIQIDRRIALSETVQWEEYRFHFGAMNGHTRFSALIGFEADGKRFAHTGDQYFFLDTQGNWTTELTRWDNKQIAQNHVYRNGALLDGYAQSAAWMQAWQPEIILSRHQPPMYTNPDFFALIDRWAHEYTDLHRQIMPLGDEEAHFNVDSWGGWIWPYRSQIASPGLIELSVTLRNPLPHAATLVAQLVGPIGWVGTSVTIRAEARAEVCVQLTITPDGPCHLQPFAVDLCADGRPYGQVAEALLTVGGSSNA